jgi:hypothetical protein
VKNGGSSYQCKPYPYAGWCNGSAWAYAPGTGSYWRDAWELIGTCAGRSRTGESSTPDEETNADVTGLSVYPNPNRSNTVHVVTLTFEKTPAHVHVHLQNTNGTEVFRDEYNNVRSNSVNVKMPALPQGLYIMRVQTENGFWVTKYLVTD